jgi:Reverse transcriptase (RNA-dependent DNA polymerase)
MIINYFYVSSKNSSKPCAWQLFTGQEPPIRSCDLYPLFCPVYILEKQLQDGNCMPSKWLSRSCLGIYIGHSSFHSGNVVLVYNPITGHTSPQFHVVFDPDFTSLQHLDTTPINIDKVLASWPTSNFWSHEPIDSDPEYSCNFDCLFNDYIQLDVPSMPPATKAYTATANPIQVETVDESNDDDLFIPTTPEPIPPSVDMDAPTPKTSNRMPPQPTSTNKDDNDSTADPKYKPSAKLNAKRGSKRTLKHKDSHNLHQKQRRISQKIKSKIIPAIQSAFYTYATKCNVNPDVEKWTQADANLAQDADNEFTSPAGFDLHAAIDEIMEANSAFLPDLSIFEPVGFAASTNEDVLTQAEMLRAHDKDEFLKAQVKEIEGLIELNVWKYVQLKDLPTNAQLINGIWSYRCKRAADNTLLKHKARFCADGSKMKAGIHYSNDIDATYTPVVQWATVRISLILSVLCQLHCRQVDFVQAFPQADIDMPVYLRLPAGWTHIDEHGNNDYCLQLIKNLYGTKSGARNWFLHLKEGLLQEGFKQSNIDPCLFLRQDCMLVIYTDDTILLGASQDTLLATIMSLSNRFSLKDKGEVNDFLGIRIERDVANGRVTLTQPGLIQTILQDLNLTGTSEKVKPCATPSTTVLHPDKDGPPREESWNYRSVLGKFGFLALNTHPEISFSVHQCAQFCNSPTLLHEKAMKCISRYLASSPCKGITFFPQPTGALDAYCDADFAGRWNEAYTELRETVLSRSGYTIHFCGCPVLWISKMQTKIALSTTEAELMALSQCLCDLIPLRVILGEIQEHGCIANIPLAQQKNILTSALQTSKVYEDNQSCLIIATSDQYRPRTKHISCKLFHWKDHIKNKTIEIHKIHTNENIADIFTKPLVQAKFEYLRRKLCGW